jgi:hypothetical protein
MSGTAPLQQNSTRHVSLAIDFSIDGVFATVLLSVKQKVRQPPAGDKKIKMTAW